MLERAIRLPLLCSCDVCGFDWICDTFIRCPVCNLGDYRVMPLSENLMYDMDWINKFFLKGGDEKKMLGEDEVRNLKLMMSERMSVIPDEREKERIRVFICALECVLND